MGGAGSIIVALIGIFVIKYALVASLDVLALPLAIVISAVLLWKFG